MNVVDEALIELGDIKCSHCGHYRFIPSVLPDLDGGDYFSFHCNKFNTNYWGIKGRNLCAEDCDKCEHLEAKIKMPSGWSVGRYMIKVWESNSICSVKLSTFIRLTSIIERGLKIEWAEYDKLYHAAREELKAFSEETEIGLCEYFNRKA